MGPHSGSELGADISSSTTASHVNGYFMDAAGGVWMQFPDGRWKLLCSDPEVACDWCLDMRPADTVHVSVFGGFCLPLHTFSCEGGPRILRSILGRTHGFLMCLSNSAVTGSVSLPCEVNSGFTGR